METNEVKDYAEIAQSIATTLGIVIGGGWVLWKFVLMREHASRPEFTVGVDFVGVHDGQWLVEVWATMANKGGVVQRMSSLGFDLRILREGDAVQDGDGRILHQVKMPHKIKEGSWLPPDWESTHVDPGVVTRYSHVASIPIDAKFVLVHAKFTHRRDGDWHTADRLQRVPTLEHATGAGG